MAHFKKQASENSVVHFYLIYSLFKPNFAKGYEEGPTESDNN